MPAIELYPYQRRWLDDQSRFKVGMFARQCGKTWTTTLEIVLDCLNAEATGQRRRWVILSRGLRQASEAMEAGVKNHLKAFQVGFEALEYDWEAKVKALEVTLPGGSRITALPSSPDTARGFSASVALDEYAFHKSSREIWKALFPVISAGHKIRVISTPNGKSGGFYDLITSQNPAWSKHTCNIYQAVAEGLPRNIEELRAGLNDEDAWRQEFLCEFVDEASAWLSYDLINSVEHVDAGQPERYGGGLCFVGNDIARRNDLWVAWVLEKVGDVLWTREIRTLRRATFAEQDAVMAELMQRYRVARMAIDQTGMGERAVEDYQRVYGSSRVEGVMFTAMNKQTLANLGKEAFEDRTLRIPIGDPALRADLHSLRKLVTPMGNVRFDSDGETDGHADRTWAGFLALYAASGAVAPIEFATMGPVIGSDAYEEDSYEMGKTLDLRGFFA